MTGEISYDQGTWMTLGGWIGGGAVLWVVATFRPGPKRKKRKKGRR